MEELYEEVMSGVCSGKVLKFYSTQCSFTVNEEKFQALTLFCPSGNNHANSFTLTGKYSNKTCKNNKKNWIPTGGATKPKAWTSSWHKHKHLHHHSVLIINTKTQETFSKIMFISASGSNLTSSFQPEITGKLFNSAAYVLFPLLWEAEGATVRWWNITRVL